MPPSCSRCVFVLSCATAACGHSDEPHGTTPDAAIANADAPASTGTCDGGDRFVLVGPVAVDSPSLGPITVEGKVAGFAGASASGRMFAFTKRRVPLDGDFEAVGVHDISTEHIKYLEKAYDADCSTPAGTCSGFFALAGTVTVTAIEPRFVATFELTDLYARSDSSNTLGPAIAGTITGCVNSRLEP